MTKAGETILEGIQDAIAYVNGEKSRCVEHFIVNTKVDVKAIREKLNQTQEEFCNDYGFSLSTLKKWETNKLNPNRQAKAYLTVIAQKPQVVKNALKAGMQS